MIIGIDVHKRKEVVCETDDSGKIVNEYDFGNTEKEWNAFMEQHREPGTRIVLEASTSGKFAARLLRDLVPELKRHFPDHWKEIIAMSVVRVMDNQPLRLLKIRREKLCASWQISASLSPGT